MKILMYGDVVGRSGRDATIAHITKAKQLMYIDVVVVNVDNAAHGFGITDEMAEQFFAAGADVLTGGNHLFDQKTAPALLAKEPRLLRPANMSAGIAGSGIAEVMTKKGQKAVVVHLLGQKNMPLIGENPFNFMNNFLTKYTLGQNVNAIVVDFHAEVSSEKNAFGHFLDGRVSAVVGTHTHIPTADDRILAGGTAFQTDLGMCGDYNSVIGMQKETIIEKFVKGYCNTRFAPTKGEATVSALMIETNDRTGLATAVCPIRSGGDLRSQGN